MSMSSEEKDPTCVVKMLENLRPVNMRKSGVSRSTVHARRGSAVATRLEFDSSLRIERSSVFSKKRIADLDTSSRSVEKRAKTATESVASGTPASPWDLRRMKGDLLQARGRIEALDNVVKQLHGLRKEAEQVFENEKEALKLELNQQRNMVEDLQSRMDVLNRRNKEAKAEMAEIRAQLMSHKQLSSERVHLLQKQNAELKDSLNESQLGQQTGATSAQWRITQLEAELQTAKDGAEAADRRAEELEAQLSAANQNKAQAEVLQQRLQDAEMQIRSLESEREDHKEAVAMAKLQQQKLLGYPELEREGERLREECARLRVLLHNKLLLEEEVACLRGRLAHSEQRDAELTRLQAAHQYVEGRLEAWLSLAREVADGADPAAAARPDCVRQAWQRMQQRELQLAAELGEAKSRLRGAVEAKNALTGELDALKKQMEKQKSMIELRENYTHRVNKKLQLVTMERNSYRSQLDAYEKDLTMPSTTALLASHHEQQRARIDALERAVEGYRELVARLEGDLEKREGATGSGGEQGAAAARLAEERGELVRANEQLGRRLEELQLEIQYRALKGDFNPAKSKVLHCRLNPRAEAEASREDELILLRAECERLRERMRVLQEGTAGAADVTLITDQRLLASSSQEVEDLRGQVKSYDLKIQRLKEAFKTSSSEIREIVYMVLGYRIDRKSSQEYHLSSMYAESPDDVLVFKYCSSTANVELIATPFSDTLTSLIDLHLRRQQSIPVFLSAVTLDLFSQQTMCTVTEPTVF